VDTAVRVRTLRKAEKILGGRSELRKYLNVSAICLAAWMAGLDTAPTDVFLKAVDVVMDNPADDTRSNF
jgi:hypothetical protein